MRGGTSFTVGSCCRCSRSSAPNSRVNLQMLSHLEVERKLLLWRHGRRFSLGPYSAPGLRCSRDKYGASTQTMRQDSSPRTSTCFFFVQANAGRRGSAGAAGLPQLLRPPRQWATALDACMQVARVLVGPSLAESAVTGRQLRQLRGRVHRFGKDHSRSSNSGRVLPGHGNRSEPFKSVLIWPGLSARSTRIEPAQSLMHGRGISFNRAAIGGEVDDQ
ncbi:hypothetical protein CFBP2044_04840 [Xanthomonas hortorum pv. cynarae]|nr:hypothetical protein CFBP2044_04840 [Xanthomonas hortorum pv. cynarae]CAD0303548.1 hypothetical protein CFBP2044_04840 [Xanthomonas hortorum pv. cynarae]